MCIRDSAVIRMVVDRPSLALETLKDQGLTVFETELLGVEGVLLNSGIALARDPVRMARAMKNALDAGREAYLAGRIERKLYATASSPVEGMVDGTGQS